MRVTKMKKLLSVMLFVVFAAASTPWIFPQTSSQTTPVQGRPDALEQYRRGRDMEYQNRMRDAEVYYNEAVRICNEEIANNRGTSDSYTVLTWTLRRQQKYAEAIVWGERGLRLFGNDFRIVQTMGEAYFHQYDYANSLRYMQRYVNSLPQGDRASVSYFYMGEAYRLQNKYRLADVAYSTALRLDPSMALWWYRLGTVRENAGESSYAADAYQRAVRLNPNYNEAINGLARTRPPAVSQ